MFSSVRRSSQQIVQGSDIGLRVGRRCWWVCVGTGGAAWEGTDGGVSLWVVLAGRVGVRLDWGGGETASVDWLGDGIVGGSWMGRWFSPVVPLGGSVFAVLMVMFIV